MLKCDKLENWINAANKLHHPEFPFLLITIQGLGKVHLVLRKNEQNIFERMRGCASIEVDLEQAMQDDLNMHLARYWIKELSDNIAIIRNGRGVNSEKNYKNALSNLAKKVSIIRQPLAKHQIEKKKMCYWPQPLFWIHAASHGWIVHDQNNNTHEISRIELAEEFIDSIL